MYAIAVAAKEHYYYMYTGFLLYIYISIHCSFSFFLFFTFLCVYNNMLYVYLYWCYRIFKDLTQCMSMHLFLFVLNLSYALQLHSLHRYKSHVKKTYTFESSSWIQTLNLVLFRSNANRKKCTEFKKKNNFLFQNQPFSQFYNSEFNY